MAASVAATGMPLALTALCRYEAAMASFASQGGHVGRDAADIVAMYRLEADAREAMLEQPRSRWIRPILRGMAQRGLRRKSVERALKLLVPRRWLGLD